MKAEDTFTKALMNKLEFPQEAKDTFIALEAKLICNDIHMNHFKDLIGQFMDKKKDINFILEELNHMADEICISNFTLHFYFFMKCSSILYERYKENNISENVYWNTVYDLKYKLLECYDVHGIWGTFVATWFPRFFDMTRFKIGRFQYESIAFPYDLYQKNDINVKKGDHVYNLHIPSAGPLTQALRMDSYKQAFEFFSEELNGQPMVIVCDSWLLYPDHEKFLPLNSNIIDFMHDFEIIDFKENDTFADGWRIFGKHHALAPRKIACRHIFTTRLCQQTKTR